MKAVVQDFQLKEISTLPKREAKKEVKREARRETSSSSELEEKPPKKPAVMKKKSKILDIIGVKSVSDIEPAKTDELDISASRPYLPLKWNNQIKKWMSHTQITVENAFK